MVATCWLLLLQMTALDSETIVYLIQSLNLIILAFATSHTASYVAMYTYIMLQKIVVEMNEHVHIVNAGNTVK